MKIKITLDAGINVFSSKVMIEEVDSEMWNNMTEFEKEDFIKEIALEDVNWDFEIISDN
jgi:hypothetical protein